MKRQVHDKILRITFNGISILTPRPRRKDDLEPDKAFVLMPANRMPAENAWGSTVEEHFPFIFVPRSILEQPIPLPDATSFVPKLGLCYIYFIDNARVVVEPATRKDLVYHTDPRPLGERPGPDDVAPEDDIRWLVDFRDILQSDAPLRKSVGDPAGPKVGTEVAVVVNLDGGTLRAGFPCKSVQPKTFEDAEKQVVPHFKRVLASEFSCDMSYDHATPTVKIRLRRLRPRTPTVGLGETQELVLKWPMTGGHGPQTIEVRMGNDVKAETVAHLGKPSRCKARKFDSLGRVILIPRDNDFFLHYRIIDSGDKEGPLPQSNIEQIHVDGCRSGT